MLSLVLKPGTLFHMVSPPRMGSSYSQTLLKTKPVQQVSETFQHPRPCDGPPLWSIPRSPVRGGDCRFSALDKVIVVSQLGSDPGVST